MSTTVSRSPGLAGDKLTLSQTSPTADGTVNLEAVNGVEELIYTAPPFIPASTTAPVSYEISDQHDDVIPTATATVTLDSGPTLIPNAPAVSTLSPKQSIAAGLIQPGLPSDTLKFTLLSVPKDGRVSLIGDQAEYTPATSPGRGAQPDTFTYEVTDNHGGTTPVGTAIIGDNGNYSETGSSTGYTSVILGNGADYGVAERQLECREPGQRH